MKGKNNFALLLTGQSGHKGNILKSFPPFFLEKFSQASVFAHLSAHVNSEILPAELVQPAVVLRSQLLFSALSEEEKSSIRHLLPNSLGEFSALIFSEMLPAAEVLDLVAFRGKLMEEFFCKTPMTTFVVKAGHTGLEELLSSTNFRLSSALSQYCSLISGPQDQAEKAKILLRRAGFPAKTLSNRYGFHHPALKHISDKLLTQLKKYNFNEPHLTWYSNATNEEINAKNVMHLLSQQLYSPVLFSNATMLTGSHCNCFIDLDSEGFLAARVKETLYLQQPYIISQAIPSQGKAS